MTGASSLDVVRALFHDAPAEPDPRSANAQATKLPTIATEIDSSADESVLAVEEVAALLRVGRNTVYALVAKNQIPHRRLGKTIRFSRAAVMSWLSTSWQVAKEGK